MSGYTIGVDFGTLSGRAVVVRVSDGEEVGAAVHEYAHGVIERTLPATGERLRPDWALQDPADYVEVLRTAVPQAVAAAGIDPADVIGIATDFTACTVLPTLADGTPLSALDTFKARPHAYAKLWKHHAAQPQADRINQLAHRRGEPWIDRYGGKISSEWQFAKALQLLEEDPEVYARTERWIEAADWIIWQLSGQETRNACTAGYKGIYQDGTYPAPDFLAELNPGFADFAETRLAHPISALGDRAGGLTAEASQWTGLPEGIAVAVGNVDAHVTSPAARAVAPGQMLLVMGTSTCHVMNSSERAAVPGICGVVDGGILAGLYGYEAGQSGVGDIFGWFVDNAVPPYVHEEAREAGVSVHDLLSRQAAEQPVGGHGLVALDWQSGNRSVLVDHHLSGVIAGLTLATRPFEIYKALIEATAFGTRKIVETFEAAGVPVTEFVAAGGLKRNPLVMQIYADVLRRPISVASSEQAPALGSAIHAAVAAGAYPDVATAAEAMGRVEKDVWQPDLADAAVYDRLYAEYARLHDYFGLGENKALHRLRAIRDEAFRPETAGGGSAAGGSAAGGSAAGGSATGGSAAGGPAVGGVGEVESAIREGGGVTVMRVSQTIAQIRAEVCDLHAHLTRWGLVTWTAGNVSARVPGEDLLVIKPSGVEYDSLTPESMVVCDLDGTLVEGEHSPSSDTASHAYVYRHMPEVNGVVHTHSPYATAWAALGEPIPCSLTAMADEFGGDIPIGPFALIGSDDIGRGIVETLRGSRSPAVLMRQHGPFTIGPTAKAAVKAAVMCEDVARTMHLARQLGPIDRLPATAVDRLFDRYQNVYGQHLMEESNE